MAITGNDSTEKTVREKTVWTGLAECKVIAINPTMKELNDIGIPASQEPDYLGKNDDGKTKARIDFWLEIQGETQTKTKMSIWLEDELRTSGAGKPQWINKYGKTGWAASIEENLEWFLQDGARQAYKSEEDMLKFFQAYLNVIYNTKDKQYDECQIDDMPAIFNGNFSELQSIIRIQPTNTVRVLLGAKVTDDGKVYQQVHNKFFEKTCVRANFKNWQKQCVDAEYGAFKGDFQGSWELQPYMQSATVPTADAETTTEAEKDAF